MLGVSAETVGDVCDNQYDYDNNNACHELVEPCFFPKIGSTPKNSKDRRYALGTQDKAEDTGKRNDTNREF